MTTATTRQQFREVLAGLAAKTLTRMPSLNGRTEKACKLVLQGDVTLHDDGTATVNSLTDPALVYRVVHRACDCKDYDHAPEHLCCHRLSVGFLRKVQELLPPAPESSPEVHPVSTPLPEAPVSITLKATLHGHEVLVTLRGHDFASVQAQVEQASQWLQSQTPQPSPPQEPEAERRFCPKDGQEMTLNHKDGRSWWSHKTAEGWCRGK